MEADRYEVEFTRVPGSIESPAHFLQEALGTATANKAACLHAFDVQGIEALIQGSRGAFDTEESFIIIDTVPPVQPHLRCQRLLPLQ